MRCMTVSRALLVRILFAGHGFIAIWRLFMVTRKLWTWYLGGALIGLLMETLITVAKNSGKEWKWFCPSVFFYLLSVVPAIWFLELHEMEERINERESTQLNSSITDPIMNITEEQLSLNVEGIGISIPLALTSDLWLRVLEQFLLLMLIVGRWVLPKGSISHDQLSQLLLVYVGTAADIVEFYEAFSEEEVKYNRLLCYIILGIWTLSLFQFCLVLTASKARRDQTGIPSSVQDYQGPIKCCNPELYGILTSIMLQDLPFLCVRLMLIFKYHVVSYTNMFFTSKNSLVIILLIYRLIVVHTTAKAEKWEDKILSPAFRDAYPRTGTGSSRKFNKLKSEMSHSTPNVFDIYSAHLKNGHLGGQYGGSTSGLNSDSLKKYNINNNRQAHRLGLPVEKITDKTGGSVGSIKAI